MGRPKALIEWGGEPLVARVCRVVAEVADPVLAVCAPGQELPLPPDIEVVRDRRPAQGPLEGLASGLAAMPADVAAVVVCPVDLPLIDARTLRILVEALDPAHDAAVSGRDGRPHPLPGVYRRSLLEDAERLLESGERRLGALLEARPAVVLPAGSFPDPSALRNINTPDDLAALRSQAGGQG